MANLGALPSEVIVHLYTELSIPDRLALARTCSRLHREYTEAATLQYDFQLTTSAYLDVINQVPERESEPTPTATPTPTEAVENKSTNSYISPHTGKLRKSIPTVKFALFPEEPSKRPSTVFISPAEKVKLLKEREEGWDTLTPKKIRKLSVEGNAGVYELQEGIFLMCDDYVEQGGAGLTRSQRPFSVRLVPLPSSSDPDLEDPILPCKSIKLEFPLSDLTMDPTQDLIVASEFIEPPSLNGLAQLADTSRKDPTHRYHLLSLSTFEPHPLAALPILDFPPTNHLTLQTRQLLQIMGDTLVILVSRFAAHWLLAGFGGLGTGNDEEIVCWNWKTGRVLARMALPENGWFSSLSVLTPTSFMITSTANISPVLPTEARAVASVFPPVIQIYSFAPDPSRDIIPQQPLDLEHVDDTTPRPVLVAQLHTPPAADGAIMGSFDVRPDPAFPPTPAGDAPMIGPRKPFTQDPAKGVLVFELQMGDPPPEGEGPDFPTTTNTYELFVLREYLVELAVEGQERLRRSRFPVAHQDRLEVWEVMKNQMWSEWGQVHARFLTQTMANRAWVCSCSGYRYISLVTPNDLFSQLSTIRNIENVPRPQDLLMLDFSPYSVKKARSRGVPATSDLADIEMALDIDPSDHDDVEGGDDIDNDDDDDNEADWVDDDDDDDMSFEFDNPYQPPIPSTSTSQSHHLRFSHESSEVDVIDDLSCIEMGSCWKEDIWSGLPYVRIRKEMGIVASGVMIDDQRVMMIASDDGTRFGAGGARRPTQDFTVLCM